jgi:hypothetical protein
MGARTLKGLLVGTALAAVCAVQAGGARAAVAVSSNTLRMMSDLESLQDASSVGRGEAQLNRFFDSNQARAVSAAAPLAEYRGGYPVAAFAALRSPYAPYTPPVSAPTYSGRSLSQISAEKKIRDSQRVSQILAEKAWGYPGSSPRYPGYGYPGSGYQGYPGYGYPRYQPTLGDRVVDGVRSFFNHIEAGWNNLRHTVARGIEPQYPYVTRYQKISTYSGEMELPIYRYRHGSYDIPGYGHIPGYRPGYGYPGFSGYYPPRMDYGNFYGYIPGHEWHQGYGYIPEQVFTSAFSGQYRFVPQTRGGGTIERMSGN